jgi:ligand-binding sensor domain-containing protein
MKLKFHSHAFFSFPAFLLIVLTAFEARSSTLFKQFSSPKNVGGIVAEGPHLWAATSGGAVRYTLASGEKKVFADLSDLPDLNLVAVIKDRAGDVWFGSAEGYLVRCNPATETFTSFNALAATGWPITCMLYFKDNIFIGSSNGLCVFSIEKGSVQNVKQFGATLTSSDVTALRSYGDTLALVTGDGIAFCVVRDMQTTIFSDPAQWTALWAPSAVGIIHENGGLKSSTFKIQEFGSTVWQYGGVDTLVKNGTIAATFPSPVTCLLPLDNNSFVIGTESSFFWVYDAATNASSQVVLDGPSDSDIKSCVIDQSGVLWYVPYSMADGICNFDGTTWTKLTYKNTPGIGFMEAGTLTDKNTIMATSKNDIWVSTFAFGLKWFNRADKKWSSYLDRCSPYYSPSNSSPLARFSADSTYWWTLVSGACEDSLGYIWVANKVPYTGAVLNVRKPRENTWRTFSIGDSALNLLSLYTGPVAANQDKAHQQQHIYLGYSHMETMTGGGLSVLSYASNDNPLTGSVSCVNSNPDHTVPVSDIAIANDTLAWLACGDGIYKMTNNDPNTIAKIALITSRDGLYAVAAGYDGRAVFCKDRDLYSYGIGDTVLTQLTNTGKLGTPVNCIILDKKRSVYWIASKKGLFRFDSGDSTAAVGSAAIDVYPNPISRTKLSPSHPVRFSGLGSANPTVRIYTAGGALVMSRTEKNKRIITWNGANLSGRVVIPGIYFYTASVGNGKYCRGKIFVIP